MLYTRKGDDGTTRTLGSKTSRRISKSSCQTEALGALDELNSFLGLAKVAASKVSWLVGGQKQSRSKGLKLSAVLHRIQNDLFVVQAEVAGSEKHIKAEQVKTIEKLIDEIEGELPPIKTFFISGGTDLAALLDVCRTLARKAERRLIKALEEKSIRVNSGTLSFMNRLSSILYALARLANFKSGTSEEAPWYN